jgi:hypothetical protein
MNASWTCYAHTDLLFPLKRHRNGYLNLKEMWEKARIPQNLP